MVQLTSFIVVLSLGLSTIASAIPSPAETEVTASTCKTPAIRKEWRTLTVSEKKNYVDAVLCLHQKPGVYENIYPGLNRTTHFEDFIYAHKKSAPYIHFVGQFFAWHRYFLQAYESALQECGLKIAHPYWDTAIDADSYANSPVWDPVTGLGGNGIRIPSDPPLEGGPVGTGGGCIEDGPFKDWRIHLARNNTEAADDRCVERSFNPAIASFWCTKDREMAVLNKTTYHDMVTELEGGITYAKLGIHGGGHGSIGGNNADLYVSPSDPAFYFHHANMDRIWRTWQKADLKNRLYEISGSPVPWTNFLGPDLSTIPSGNVTLDFEIGLEKLAPNREIRTLMDTKGGFLCYDYAIPPKA